MENYQHKIAESKLDISEDYAALRQLGIDYISRLGSEQWTDYNSHDPGITILEQVCYAMTDLGYRMNHSMSDLLAQGGKDPYDSLIDAPQILSSNPVTLMDLRKLIIDIKGVKNAWIEPALSPQPALYFNREKKQLKLQPGEELVEPVVLQGLYQVLVEPDRDFQNDLYARVAQRLHAHRNLCEDYSELSILTPQKIQLHARIEISAQQDAEQLLQNIFSAIETYFSAPVNFYSLNECLQKGLLIDDIFNGVQLEHGFIDTLQLQQLERRTQIRISDLIQIIMAVAGVRTVQRIRFEIKGEEESAIPNDWLLTLDQGAFSQLDLHNSDFILVKEQLQISLPKADVISRYRQLKREQKITQSTRSNVPELPSARTRNIEQYTSIMHQFPDAYGVNANGLAQSEGRKRLAQAKQLKGYLVLFDQLLANNFSQLAHVKELFSFKDALPDTYFYQLLEDVQLGLDDEQDANNNLWAKNRAQRSEFLNNTIDPALNVSASLTTNAGGNSARRNQFLDHLLARFAEQFNDYSLALSSLEAGASELTTPSDDAINAKQHFLENYVQASATRGTAFNYLKPISASNISGLEQRIRLKLGITSQEEDFYIIEHILLRPITADIAQQAPLISEVERSDPYSLQLSFMMPDWSSRFANTEFRKFVTQVIYAQTPAHLYVYIKWVTQEQMQSFIETYQEGSWLENKRSFWQKSTTS